LDLAAGSHVDRYVIEGPLGVGGTAVVYLVRHAHLGARYALKVLRSPHPDVRRRLLREGQLQSRLRHPNVVAVLDIVDVDGAPGLVMEYITGPSLADFMAALQPTREQIDALARDVLSGVAAAHALGMVHRDLKPANVLLEPSDGRLVARVADFGMAKLLDTGPDDEPGLTRTGVVLGTPSYMAPEQATDASHVDARADVWALGAMLYELITGRRLLTQARAFQSLRSGVVDFASPRSLVPEIPERWERAVLAALRIDRDERPADAQALLEIWGEGEAGTWDVSAMTAEADRLREGRRFTPAPVEETYGTLSDETLSDESTGAGVVRALPPELDAFVGRGDELERIASAAAGGQRLLTLSGPAGAGKTRLARRYAWRTIHDWSGVWFCDLSEAVSAEGACFAVGRALGVPVEGADPVGRVGEVLRGWGRCLVLLDNFEQLTDAAAETIGRWLERAPQAVFLVTSRERLRVEGEHLITLEPLPVPQDGAARIADNPAVMLFVERARRAQPRFALTPMNAGDIGALVRLLEGLPLAIELAAARARVMSPAAMVTRLSAHFGRGRLRLLSASGHSGERSIALRAALETSWELLDEVERAALSQLSAFEGGFELAAAEGVLSLASVDPEEEPWVIDVLQSLVDKSLVRSGEGRGDSPRFSLFLSIQGYAAEKLAAAGDGDAVHQRHAAWYARLGAREALRALDSEDGGARRVELTAELGNLTAAARRGRGEDRLRAGLAAAQVMLLQGPLTGAVALAERLLADSRLAGGDRPPELQELRFRALFKRGEVAAIEAFLDENPASPASPAAEAATLRRRGEWLRKSGDIEGARAALESALALGGLEPEGEASALTQLGGVHQVQSRPREAREALERALTLCRASGSRRLEADALSLLGNLETSEGHYQRAEVVYKRALSLFQELGDRSSEAVAQGRLGYLGLFTNDAVVARRWLTRSLEANRRVGNRSNEGTALCNLGSTWLLEGRFDKARGCFEEAVAVSREAGSRVSELISLQSLGNALSYQGELEDAEAALETVLEAARAGGDDWIAVSVELDLAMVLSRLGRLDEAESLLTEVVNKARDLNVPRRVAAGLFALAGVRAGRGDQDGEQALLREALAVEVAELSPAQHARQLAELARAQAQAGHAAAASATLAEADALAGLPEGIIARIERLICQGWVQLARGDHRPARADMEAAWLLIARMGVGPRSGFVRRVTALREALDSASPEV